LLPLTEIRLGAAVTCGAIWRRLAGTRRPDDSQPLSVDPHLKVERHLKVDPHLKIDPHLEPFFCERRILCPLAPELPDERDLSAGLARLFADHERID
jgi:hypothetical protein